MYGDLANHFFYLSLKALRKQRPSPRASEASDSVMSKEYWKAFNLLREMEASEDGIFKDVNFAVVDESLPLSFGLDTKAGRITEYRPTSSAIIAPAFMACRPPAWLWRPVSDWNSDPREEWKSGPQVNEADMPERKKVKEAFDEAAGDLYRKFAYEPVYRLVRRLGWLAVCTSTGTSFQEALESADPNEHEHAKMLRDEVSELQRQWQSLSKDIARDVHADG